MVGGPSPFDDDDDDISRSGEVVVGIDISASTYQSFCKAEEQNKAWTLYRNMNVFTFGSWGFSPTSWVAW